MASEPPNKEESRKLWDQYITTSVNVEEETKQMHTFVLQTFCHIALGMSVLILALVSKVSILLLISATNDDSEHFANKPFCYLLLGCTLLFPSILIIGKGCWNITFRPECIPSKYNLLTVCALEAIACLGSTLLVIVCLPHFDILTNLFICNSIYLMPSILQVLKQKINLHIHIVGPLVGLLLLSFGLIFFAIEHSLDVKEVRVGVNLGFTIFSSGLLSLTWWENFTSNWQHPLVLRLKHEIDKSRNVVNVATNTVRIIVTAVVVGAWVSVQGKDWATLSAVESHEIRILLIIFALQAGASTLCCWFGGIACKIRATKICFAFPLVLNTPIVLTCLLLLFRFKYNELLDTNSNHTITEFCSTVPIALTGNSFTTEILSLKMIQSICSKIISSTQVRVGLLGVAGICWWLGLIFTTNYVWSQNNNRIERTSKLFVRRMYEAAFVEQSMLLNRRTQMKIYPNKETEERKPEQVKIYICVTMWHETAEEMIRIISSLFRLDRFKAKREGMPQKSDDHFDFEVHIMFDDAFRKVKDKNSRTKKHIINEYVQYLISAIEETYRMFERNSTQLFPDKIDAEFSTHKVIPTPYGGRLSYTMPYGSYLQVHLKDKEQIRHRKRWSQVMYLYYFLGWRLFRKYSISQQLHPEDKNDIQRNLKREKMNTYILALDGDVEFQPSAVTLLIDKLRRFPELGAACGRIHPTGIGPMIWYQKFEYAVGHWLQKTAEHVLGCVLCSPGCFSLFRAAALMDDNVMRRYTTKPTTGLEHLQFDQGEDRWLCLLMLQQGWRIEYCAGSDSYTNAPQEFKEFFNQRRRWDPSKLANTIDLLASGSATAKRNPCISRPYLLYQLVYMAATLVAPATVCLMVAVTMTYVFDWNPIAALVVSVIIPLFYIIVCYNAKSDTQILVGGLLSIIYVFFMISALFTIVGTIVKSGTIISPSGIFITSMMLVYLICALLHPKEFHLVAYGPLYFLCIPAGSVVLSIYTFVNLNVTSWGTRESSNTQTSGNTPTAKETFLKQCKLGPWYLYCTVRKRVKNAADKETQQRTIAETVDNVEENLPLENCWIPQLTGHGSHTPFVEDTLEEDETLFWYDLIDIYLKPFHEDKAYLEKANHDLLTLRNKAVFIYMMINAIWIVATVILQIVASTIVIRIPKFLTDGSYVENEFIYVDPLGIMFIISFALLVLVQFFTMLYHRIYTLIHLLSHAGTESFPKQSDDYPLVQTKKHRSGNTFDETSTSKVVD